MAKVEISDVEYKMQEVGVTHTEIKKVIEALKQEIELDKADKQKSPKVEKYKYIIANTDCGNVTNIDEYPMVVVEADESVLPISLVDEIKYAIATANNDCKKLKKSPIVSLFDGIERVPAKFFKQKKIRIISKTATQLIQTTNKL